MERAPLPTLPTTWHLDSAHVPLERSDPRSWAEEHRPTGLDPGIARAVRSRMQRTAMGAHRKDSQGRVVLETHYYNATDAKQKNVTVSVVRNGLKAWLASPDGRSWQEAKTRLQERPDDSESETKGL